MHGVHLSLPLRLFYLRFILNKNISRFENFYLYFPLMEYIYIHISCFSSPCIIYNLKNENCMFQKHLFIV